MSETQSSEAKLRLAIEYLESINDLIHEAAHQSRYVYFRSEEEDLIQQFHKIWDSCDSIREDIDTALYIIDQALKNDDEAEA
jgi:hypothetical protein